MEVIKKNFQFRIVYHSDFQKKKKKKRRREQTIFLENHIRITRKKKKKKLVLHKHTPKYLLYQAHFYKYCTIYIRPTVLKNVAHPNVIFYLQ